MEIIAEKKKAILESTLKLIKENGFHGTPMSLVAKKAGVAAGTIYHYFDSKDTLIMELFEYTQFRLQQAMLKNLREDMDFKEGFFLRWTSRYHFFIQNPDVLFFIEQFVNSPYFPRCPQERNERIQNEIKQFIGIGKEQGVFRDLDQNLMSIMVHSSIITAAKIQIDGKLVLGENEISQLAQMMWDSIRKQ
ncbi:TetR/AcrR family transcriptional regulator [Rufibacter glacialis]|uniref:TetR/AcrR family transcriptional regulator n=1 Tax=Rufibacter glacialis TaxID=1259555 RepID=A0A5M8Q4F9_9BACT|nr:TetR/AcrR family transcriptional regulator [Rufibacter glacialis]KAA6430729.1 TetR/AcrR family transcriptional regulator [Rufibacter glacialis]GGK86272.1 TetR family transcriptional regulator [Rufibacter glacialis]